MGGRGRRWRVVWCRDTYVRRSSPRPRTGSAGGRPVRSAQRAEAADEWKADSGGPVSAEEVAAGALTAVRVLVYGHGDPSGTVRPVPDTFTLVPGTRPPPDAEGRCPLG
ncbi:hypothetical protein GCM10010358_48130 [Streptomyces minutiscleroticus]|uniref:Uncharacterized protein n=1 Tax=Streptomyces minutiscleroticus TaxID=68238 RepID=A0A918U3X0_9ACTN|nr:hypothetical protein GCM10010358_48130 [Streptomyces minutiscleroticus]